MHRPSSWRASPAAGLPSWYPPLGVPTWHETAASVRNCLQARLRCRSYRDELGKCRKCACPVDVITIPKLSRHSLARART